LEDHRVLPEEAKALLLDDNMIWRRRRADVRREVDQLCGSRWSLGM